SGHSPMQDAFAHCEGRLRAADKDRFLTTLFAPAEHRDALFALYAFNVEIARVREVVREPVAGEIRLQWWHDVLGGGGRGEVAVPPGRGAVARSPRAYRPPAGGPKAVDGGARFGSFRGADGDARRSRGLRGRRLREPHRARGANPCCRRRAGYRRAESS